MTETPDWQLVVGLEVHAELATATKLFCGCPNTFGAEPNTNICPVCLGLPGSLPVVNGTAVDYAMRLGRALGCAVQPAVFARKNYFYPDMPKDYQISQYDLPTSTDGYLVLPDGSGVGITRAHIEEDTGKNTHVGGDGRIHGAEYSLIDYNRAGVPLVEIVSEPDIRSVDQARSYVTELRSILVALGVSDAKMEEGSMRVDANVSVRPAGTDELRTRCEIKNVNSIRSLGRAIAYEAQRHQELYETGDAPDQETRHWDEASGRTRPGRSKSDADDYRYFPEPDLPPLAPSPAEVAATDAALPVLPSARRVALAELAGLSAAEVTLVVERGHDDFAAGAIAAGAEGATVVKHLEHNLADGLGRLTPEALATLVGMESAGDLSATQAKTVLAALVADGGDPRGIATTLGFEAMESSELEMIIDQLIADHPDEWHRLVDGDQKLRGFFIGGVMKATKGQADGSRVDEILAAKLST